MQRQRHAEIKADPHPGARGNKPSIHQEVQGSTAKQPDASLCPELIAALRKQLEKGRPPLWVAEQLVVLIKTTAIDLIYQECGSNDANRPMQWTVEALARRRELLEGCWLHPVDLPAHLACLEKPHELWRRTLVKDENNQSPEEQTMDENGPHLRTTELMRRQIQKQSRWIEAVCKDVEDLVQITKQLQKQISQLKAAIAAGGRKNDE